ncbi:MAG TPA: hypothetical protein VH561_02160 [Micromonosporaceae bacterium]|jgi:hypothetical protein
MSTQARPRVGNERWYDREDEQRYGVRGGRDYGAYTSGANALRVERLFVAPDFDDDDFDDADFDDDDIAYEIRRRPVAPEPGSRPSRTEPAAARTAAARSAAERSTAAKSTAAKSGSARSTAARSGSARNAVTGRRASVARASSAEASIAPAPLPMKLPKASFVALMVGLVVVGVVGVLVLNTKINENSFRLGDLRQTNANLTLQEQQLQQQLDELESPGNLGAAGARLGLVPAGTPRYINLPDGRVVAVPQPASGR